MTTNAKTTETKPVTIVVLGLDRDSKPHAARFSGANTAAVLRAAAMMKFHAVNVEGGTLLKAAGELPEGKIFATGRGLVPFVRRVLYDQFAGLVGTKAERAVQLAASEAPKPASVTSQAAQPTSAPSPASKPIQPGTEAWDGIGVGSTVLAYSSLDEGWYEAVVLAVSDDKSTLTLTWRDYPSEPKLSVKRTRVGLFIG